MTRLLTLCVALILVLPATAAASRDRLPPSSVLGGGFKSVRSYVVPAADAVRYSEGIDPASVVSSAGRTYRRRTRARISEEAAVGVTVFRSPEEAARFYETSTLSFAASSISPVTIGEASAARRGRYIIGNARKHNVQVIYLKGAEVWNISVERSRRARQVPVGTVVGIAQRNAARG